MKINTYQSTQGELFTGSQAALMKKYGITSHKGFTRPGGAVDAAGDRWKLEGEVINKRKLYLAGTAQDHHKITKEMADGSKKEFFTKKYTTSDLACLYLDALKVVKAGYTYRPNHWLTEEEQLEFFQEQLDLIKEVNAEWNVVDNYEWRAKVHFGELEANAFLDRHYANNPELVSKRAWDRDISDEEYLNKFKNGAKISALAAEIRAVDSKAKLERTNLRVEGIATDEQIKEILLPLTNKSEELLTEMRSLKTVNQ